MLDVNQTRKMTFKLKWKVSKYRKDKRTGVISPIPRSKYGQMLYEEADKMFKER